MKRAIRIVVLACTLTIGAAGSVDAHRITVTTPDGTVVRNAEDLARNLTPDHPKKDGSAASQGTNTACEAIPEQSAVTITGGTC